MVDKNIFPTFYACQPCLNHLCTKERCYLNGGLCYCTFDKNSAALLYGTAYFPYTEFPSDLKLIKEDIETGKYSIVHLVSEFLKANPISSLCTTDVFGYRGSFVIDLAMLLGINPLYLTLDELDELYSKFEIICVKINNNHYALLIEIRRIKNGESETELIT